MKLVGDVSGEDDFIVFGTVEGEVHIAGALVVERSGSVRGNVQARTVAIRGVVVGDASATEAIRVDEGGRVVGDVRAPRVNIVKGARFRGHVHMTGRAEQGRDESAVQATLAPRAIAPTSPTRRLRRRRDAEAVEMEPTTEQPTTAGSVRAVHTRRTLPGADIAALERKPPPPRIPGLQRTRARRKDAP